MHESDRAAEGGSTNARRKYPLDDGEERSLVLNLAASQGLLVLLGFAGAAVLAGLTSGDWAHSVFGFGWIGTVVDAVTTGLPYAPAVGLALACAFLALAWAGERIASGSGPGRDSILSTRRGINGELPRLPVSALAVLMALTGFAEELLFRFAAIGLLLYGSLLFMPPTLGAIVAVFVSSFVFWLSHVRYRDFWSSALTLIIAVMLGVAYLVTGSLLAVAVAHAAYDFAELLIERRKMVREPDYFGGETPNRVILDAMDQAQNRKDRT